MQSRLPDAEAADELLQIMNEAAEQFQNASDTSELAPLKSGLAQSKKALQKIISLKPAENSVQQQQQQQSASSSSSNSRQQQQLNSMELEEQENRYESQRTEEQTNQESEAERENRALLNRLSELARRQDDLNQRMKELSAALLEAKSPEEQEELEKELKRLRGRTAKNCRGPRRSR